MSNLLLYSDKLEPLLPTLDHHKQICYLCCHSDQFNTIKAFTAVVDIQYYMFNMNITIERIKQALLTCTSRFYIEPNTYTNTLTLKQFFHCINIKYNSSGSIDTCRYKYNIFYKGEKFNNVYDTFNNYSSSSPINKQLISCHYIGITEGKGDDNFKNLSVEHFTTLLKIMGKEYASSVASYQNDYICKYWEDKDIELYLEYVMKDKNYYYQKCLEKNIQKNNYTQEKLLSLYSLYLKYDNSTVLNSPLYYIYSSITKILKKYIDFPTVRLGFDTTADTATKSTIIQESEIIDKILCVVPNWVYIDSNSEHGYIISDFIILDSGKIIFRVKKLKNDRYSYECTIYECDPNLFNKPVCMVMFSNRYTNTQFNLTSDVDMAIYYDMRTPSKFIVGLQFMPHSSKILPNKSHADFIADFINIKNNKLHIFRLYTMSNSINGKNKKILTLETEYESLELHAIECASYAETIEQLQKKCIELETANAILQERNKILDESNF